MNHLKLFASRFCTHAFLVSIFSVTVVLFGLLAGCTKEQPKPQAPPPEVAVIKIVPRDVPVSFEYVAQTQSSQQVEIRARVSGFLDKRTYTEGTIVKEGTVLFLMDKKPFQAQLDAMQGALAQQQARLVAFARELRNQGLSIMEATIQAGEERLRPIIMTSLAFILGVLPLAIAKGAGANARHSIGTGIMGGMIGETTLAMLYVPLFFYIFDRLSERKGKKKEASPAETPPDAPQGGSPPKNPEPAKERGH